MDPRAIARLADPARRVGRRIEYHPRIGSTNDRVREALAAGTGDGLVVVADEQLAGRGRRGRTWLSPPGRNLMLSIGLRTQIDAQRAWELGAATSLALRAAAAPITDLWLKWPNDVVAREGLKVAGILVELTLSADALREAAIGMGINVNWRRDEMPTDIAAAATSLADLAGRDVDRVALLAALCDELSREIDAIESAASPLDRYRSAAWLTGRWVRVVDGERDLEGRALDVAADGTLVLDSDGSEVAVSYGDVVSVRAMVEAEA